MKIREMKIRVAIEVLDEDDSACGDTCPFLKVDTCVLFSEELKDTELPKDHIWSDCELTKQRYSKRCSNCIKYVNKGEEMIAKKRLDSLKYACLEADTEGTRILRDLIKRIMETIEIKCYLILNFLFRKFVRKNHKK